MTKLAAAVVLQFPYFPNKVRLSFSFSLNFHSTTLKKKKKVPSPVAMCFLHPR